jgi:hypothetical protein
MGPTWAIPIAASVLWTATKRGSNAPAAGRAGAHATASETAAPRAAHQRRPAWDIGI